MTRVFYWSDPHIGHSLVAGLRGFDSPAEHDAAFADAWASTVTKRDSVWILGDLTVGNPARALPLIESLPGTKHLILGNHDPAHPLHSDAHRHQRKYFPAFQSVQTGATRTIGNRTVLLSHFPFQGDHADRADRYNQWRLRDEGSWLVHGHVHEAWKVNGRQINVGVDHWKTGPAETDQLAAIIEQTQKETRL